MDGALTREERRLRFLLWINAVLALDTSARGDALYRFVFGTLFGLGSQAPRAGFPHMDVAPVCTLGWREPVAALKVGPRVLLVRFAGARVESVRFAGVP